MTKVIVGSKEYELEDKDAALIEAIQSLTQGIIKLGLNNGRR